MSEDVVTLTDALARLTRLVEFMAWRIRDMDAVAECRKISAALGETPADV